MPKTVKACFELFNKNNVNIESEQSGVANSSRDWLLGQIHIKCAKGILPSSYSERDIKYGSFARKTKIRPLNDIDLMVCYKGQGGRYRTTGTANIYDIVMPDNIKILSELRNDDGTLNSRRIVENLKNSLQIVPQYQRADIHRNQEAATLKLLSYDWNFDIVPCFYTVNNFYLIPDGNGRWKPTDPRVDKERLENADANVSMVRQIIRTMKYWKKRVWRNSLGSYPFEQLLLSIIEKSEIYDIQRNIMLMLDKISSDILNDIPDPKGYQNNLNTLTMDDRKNLSAAAAKYATLANDAYIEEAAYGNHQKAIGIWKNIFGDDFPDFE